MRAELFSNSGRQIGPGGSIFPVDTEAGEFAVVILRTYEWMKAPEGGHIVFDNPDLPVVLDLPDEPREVTYRRLATIAYRLADDGAIDVLGSSFHFVE